MNSSEYFSSFATLIFAGESKDGRALFGQIRDLLKEYRHTVKGNLRESYSNSCDTEDKFVAQISSVDYELSCLRNVVVLYYDYSLDVSAGDSFNRDKITADILDRLEIRATKLGYTECTQCLQGAPFVRTFTKPCKGLLVKK